MLLMINKYIASQHANASADQLHFNAEDVQLMLHIFLHIYLSLSGGYLCVSSNEKLSNCAGYLTHLTIE